MSGPRAMVTSGATRSSARARLLVWCLVLLLFGSVAVADVQPVTNMTAYNTGHYGYNPNQTYRSNPKIVAPVFGINIWDAERLARNSKPMLFFTMHEPGVPAKAYIFNATDLSLVWAWPEDKQPWGPDVMNFRPQTSKGVTYLTFWGGRNVHGHGDGSCRLLDQSYQEVYTVTAQDHKTGSDLHECTLTQEGTALLSVYKEVKYDMRKKGGTGRDTLLECYFQEVDIETGKLLFTWTASDWFSPTNDSYENFARGKVYDFFHLNSVQKDRDGNYLISARHVHAIALISGKKAETPGKPIWILGGRQNQFTDLSDGKALDFQWQHHARFRNEEGTDLTFFDNHHKSNHPGGKGCTKDCSKAMRLHLDPEAKRVSLAAAYGNPEGVMSPSMGSVQALDAEGVPNGHLLVGWGSNPAVTEHDQSDGTCIMDIQFGPYEPGYKFGGTVSSYRVFKNEWFGDPVSRPAIGSDYKAETVYVSWNGATEVRSWAVYAANQGDLSLAHFTTVAKSGFETAIPVPKHSYIQIIGLDSNGLALGSTAILNYPTNAVIDSSESLPPNELRRILETQELKS